MPAVSITRAFNPHVYNRMMVPLPCLPHRPVEKLFLRFSSQSKMAAKSLSSLKARWSHYFWARFWTTQLKDHALNKHCPTTRKKEHMYVVPLNCNPVEVIAWVMETGRLIPPLIGSWYLSIPHSEASWNKRPNSLQRGKSLGRLWTQQSRNEAQRHPREGADLCWDGVGDGGKWCFQGPCALPSRLGW